MLELQVCARLCFQIFCLLIYNNPNPMHSSNSLTQHKVAMTKKTTLSSFPLLIKLTLHREDSYNTPQTTAFSSSGTKVRGQGLEGSRALHHSQGWICLPTSPVLFSFTCCCLILPKNIQDLKHHKSCTSNGLCHHCQRNIQPLPFVSEHWWPLPGPNCPPVLPAMASAAVIICFT